MEQLFLDVVNLSVTAGWVIAVVLVLRMILKPVPKKYVCLLWFVVLFRLLCPVTLESEFSLVPQHEEIRYEIVYTTPQIETDSEPVNNVLNQTVNPVLQQNSAPNPMGSVNPLQVYIFIAAWLWVIGMIILCGYTLISWMRLRHQLAESVPDGENIYLSDAITSPFVFGITRPKIYLPYGLDDDERRWVLAHEQSHIARKDFIVKPIFWLAVILHWMNPLVWMAWFCFSRDLELACDERATESMNSNEKWNYSNTLLNLAVEKRSLKCPVAFSNNGVKQRIERILKYQKLPTVIIGVVLVVLIICGMGLLMNPKPVMTLGEYRPSLMQQYEKNESITIEWGSVTVKISDPVQMNELKTQLADVQVKKDSAQEETRDTGGMIILLYEKDEEDGVMQSQIAFNTDCSIIYGGDDLQILKPEVFQYILWKHCRNAIYQYPETSYYADLNHDGNDECIVVNIDEWDTMERARMAVYEQNGTILFNRDLYGAHAGWGNYFLCEQDGRDYLLEFMPTMYQGYATYSWKLIDFDANNELRIVEEDSIEFTVNPQQFDFDIDAILAFLERAERMIRPSMLLVSTEDGVLEYSMAEQFRARTAESYIAWWLEDSAAYQALTSQKQAAVSLREKLQMKQDDIYYSNLHYELQMWMQERQGFDAEAQYLDNPKLMEIDGDRSVSFEWRRQADDRLIGIYAISTMDVDDFADVNAGYNYYQYDMADDQWTLLGNSAELAMMQALADKWAQTYGAETEEVNASRYALLSTELQKSVDTMRAENGAAHLSWLPYSMYARLPIVESYQITLHEPTGQGNDSYTEHYSASIHYEGYDGEGNAFITEEIIALTQENGSWVVIDGETMVYCMTEATYLQTQKILNALKDGHYTWLLEPEQVAMAFAHTYLGLAGGDFTAWDREKQMLTYTVDGKDYGIYLSQPVKNVLQPAYNFWYVNGYDQEVPNADGEMKMKDYYISLEEWAELHLGL